MTYQVKKPVSKFAFQVHNLQRYSVAELENLPFGLSSKEQVRFIPPHNGEPELCGGAGQVEFS